MHVVRVLNNNAVLAQRNDGMRVVLMGKGLGFASVLGDPVDAEHVQHTFVPDGTHPVARLANLVADLPADVLEVTAEIAQRIHERTGMVIAQSLLLALADHISLAVRLPEHGKAAYPLAWEVAQLFPGELQLGREAIALVQQRLGVQLPPEEATAFALHFVNAQFSIDDMARTEQVTRRIRQVLDVVQSTLGLSLDAESMGVARFVTHLRYLFVRLERDRQISDESAVLREAIAAAHPRAHRAAQRLESIIDMDGRTLTSDEVAYLTLHIARLESEG